MRAVVKEDCLGCPEGHTTKKYVKDQVVEGAEAEYMLKHKLAKKAKNAPETKKAEEPEVKSAETEGTDTESE